jgi:cell division protein FtsB
MAFQDRLRNGWRKTTGYFGVDSIAVASERRQQEATRRSEIEQLRGEVDQLRSEVAQLRSEKIAQRPSPTPSKQSHRP